MQLGFKEVFHGEASQAGKPRLLFLYREMGNSCGQVAAGSLKQLLHLGPVLQDQSPPSSSSGF